MRHARIVLVTVGFVAGLLAVASAAAGEDEKAAAGGIALAVETGTWPLDEPLEKGITAVWLEIENGSGRSLKLRFRDFAVVGTPDDRRYGALPLHDVLRRSGGEEPVVEVDTPRFGRVSFRIAPGYSDIFAGSEAFPSHFGDDREYDRYHRENWTPDRKPTLEMFARMLPEGVLGPGGLVSGFLYFHQVDPWDRGWRLEVDLVDAESGEILGHRSLPLAGDEE